MNKLKLGVEFDTVAEAANNAVTLNLDLGF
jgi:hypothetical protein